MSAVTPDDLHGFLLLDGAFGHDNQGAGTSVTQAGPEPDAPQPDASNTGYLDLRQIGDALTNDEMTVTTVSPGEASANGSGGSYIWRDSASTDDTDYLGWLAYRHITDIYIKSSGPTKDLSAVRMSDGTVIIAGSGSTYPKCLYRAPDETSWTAVNIDSTITVAPGVAPSALMVVPRDGGERVLFLQVQRRGIYPSPSDEYSVHIYASDDAGQTWQQIVWGGRRFSVPNTSVPYRLSACYHDGFITAMFHNIDGGTVTWYHIVSPDMGASWVTVESYATGTKDLNEPQCYRTPLGQVIIIYRAATSSNLYAVVKPSPYQTLIDAPTWDTDIQLGNRVGLNYQSFRSTLATDGRIYIQAREASSNADSIDLLVIRPDQPDYDYTLDSRYFERGSFRTGDATECLDRPASGTNISPPILVEYRDQFLYAGGAATQAGTRNTDLWFAHFGGYSSIDWLDIGADRGAESTRLIHGCTYLPISVPSGWGNATVTSTGTETILSSGRLRGATTGAQVFSVAFACGAAGAGASMNRVAMFRAVDVAAGGSETTDDIFLGAVWSDGTRDINVRIRLSDTSVGLYDTLGAASKFTATGLPSGEKDWAIISSYSTGANVTVGVFYRQTTTRIWTYVNAASVAHAVSGGAVVDTLNVKQVAGSGDTDVSYGLMQLLGAQDIGVLQWPLAHPAAWPQSLSGRPFSTVAHDLSNGRRLYAAGGPAYYPDKWTVGTRYSRGISNIDPQISPSPAMYWQSTSNAEQVIEWDLGRANRPLNGTIGIYLGRTNFRTAYVESWNGSTWDSVATIDTATGTAGLSYTLDGRILTAAGTGTAATRYIHMDETDGQTIVLDTGGTPSAHKSLGNSEGVWAASHGRKPLIRVSGSLGGVATSGLCDICADAVTVLIHNVTAAKTKWRLRIPASQTIPDDGYRIGVCLIGPMFYLPQVYDWGRSIGADTNVDVTEGRDGRRFAVRRGQARRYVDVAWPGGTDTTQVYALDPDYYEPASGYAAAGVVSDAQALEAALVRSDGPLNPVVYLARVPEPSAATQVIVGREAMLYGRLSGGIQRRAVLGQEYSTEVIAVDSITVEEEV